MKKGEMIYEGKAKRLYLVENQPELIWQEFKNSLTAFNAQKKGEFEGKGRINCQISTLIFKHLKRHGIDSHWVQTLSANDMLTQRLQMLKVEVVVRNVLAGSTAKKLGFTEGTPMEQPLVEFYYKDDALADPFISDDQALLLKIVQKQSELDELKHLALQINKELRSLFAKVQIELIDFKIELGKRSDGRVVLGDEITPDTCRLWEYGSHEKLDKDRFRRDLGRVQESYEKVLGLLSKAIAD